MNIVNKGLTVGIQRVAAWGSYGWLRHGFSTREGGVSTVYGGNSLNLGWTKDDDPALVTENRRLFSRSAQNGSSHGRDFQTVTLKQIHSALVLPIREKDGVFEGKLQTCEGRAVWEADGAVTDLPGVMLGVQTADCVPVLIADVNKRAVAAIHAGWRGTVSRIVEQGVASMRDEYGSRPEDLVAAVGPSIGSCCYAVGEEVRSEFGSQFKYADALFTTIGAQIYLDLWEANRRQLLDAGVEVDKVTMLGECTACSVSHGERKYFSHRDEHGFTGRMMSVIGVVG
jgi:polyphenol oxidase